jgi:AraC-like DNA-binding protein
VLLGKPVRDIVDRIVPLSELWGEPGERLADALGDVGSDAAMAGHVPVSQLLQDAPADRWPARRPGALSGSYLAYQAAMLLSTSPDATAERVRATARKLHVSERHLRNLFIEAVGVPPKHYSRLDRVRAVLAHGATQPWPQLAAGLGYHGQSHMTAEFRRIMGVPPSAFFTGRLPTASQCDQQAR